MFKFENCLLKHHIRVNGWLPLCKKRLDLIRQGRHPKDIRRLRYFTFCAVGAIDVLMLDVEKIIRRSIQEKFDTVFFFDKDPENVTETQKRIPGAIGFPADFVDVALQIGSTVLPVTSKVIPGSSGPDTSPIRNAERQAMIADQFRRHFPFDVVNLDLEEFLFKPRDEYPGKVLNALRYTFACQRQPLSIGGKTEFIDGFTLMFTTKIGPFNLPNDYLNMLEAKISENLSTQPTLMDIFNDKTGTRDVRMLRKNNFDLFFKLAVPKVIAAALHDEDWFVAPEYGIKVFEFERPHSTGTYKLLHLAMEVRRQKPNRDRRAPGEHCREARTAYTNTCLKLFRDDAIMVSEATINKKTLQKHLDRIKARRRKYFPDEKTEIILSS